MDVFLDPNAGGKKTAVLFEQLRDAIVLGRLSHGDRLPTTRGLADELGVSRNTITTVYGRLAAEGYISGRTSAGSVVTYANEGKPARSKRPAALRAVNRGINSASEWSLGGFDDVAPVFDLRSGRPDPALFPLVEWRRAVTAACHLRPGGYCHPAGQPTLRRAIAHWIGRSRAVEADPDQVIITAGAQQGIDLIARLLVRPGETVVVEEPGYPPIRSLLHALGANVVPVQLDDEGLAIGQLPINTRLIYVTPAHQSPTGTVMSLSRRRALLDFADTHDIAIIEDDYDSEYRHQDRPLEPLYRLDNNGRVVYVGSFSKTLSPSLRLGFVVLPPSLIDDAIALRSLMDWQPPESSQHALHQFIVDGHLERHLRRSRRHYSQRHRIVTDYMQTAVTSGLLATVHEHLAGLHTTADLAPGITEANVRTAASRNGIALGSYEQCWQTKPHPEGIIVGFGAIATTELATALAALDTSLWSAARISA